MRIIMDIVVIQSVFNECSRFGEQTWNKNNNCSNVIPQFSPQMHMFIARYCDLLNVVISCDGCERMAPWHRYRCLQCTDMDLCKTCFLSEFSLSPATNAPWGADA